MNTTQSFYSPGMKLLLKYKKRKINSYKGQKEQQSQILNPIANSKNIEQCKYNKGSKITHNFHYVACEGVDIDSDYYRETSKLKQPGLLSTVDQLGRLKLRRLY